MADSPGNDKKIKEFIKGLVDGKKILSEDKRQFLLGFCVEAYREIYQVSLKKEEFNRALDAVAGVSNLVEIIPEDDATAGPSKTTGKAAPRSPGKKKKKDKYDKELEKLMEEVRESGE